MKVWAMNNSVIIFIWLFCFIFFIIIKSSFSDVSTTTTTTTTALAKRPPNLLPPTRHDAVLVATMDGTISLMEIESRKILWSIKTGLPIYSSYQASQNLDVNLENAFEVGDDTYVDCGDDWNLYKHDRGKGIMERLKGAKDLLLETNGLSEKGSTVIGQMATTVFVVDAKTGTVVRSVKFSGSSDLGFENGENPVVVREESKEQISITRTDYSFMAYSKISHKILWNVTLSEFDAESFHLELESSTTGSTHNQVGSFYKGPAPTCCPRRTIVYRIRDHGFSDFIYGLGLSNEMPRLLPGGRHLPLPAPEHAHLPLEFAAGIRNDPNPMLALPSQENIGCIPSELEMLALPSVETQTADHSGNVMRLGSSVAHFFFSPIISSFLLLLALGYAIFLGVFRNSKQSDDFKSKAMTTKKKKSRKGSNKNNSPISNPKQSISKSDESGLVELQHVDKNLQAVFAGFVNAPMDGRNIGKLWVSGNEIAKGSNGTVVYEGIYDGRPVAVKRLVRTHHDVAVKEIQNLMASDQHPNIVRFYGVELDPDFVYLSLERCLCSLNDLIFLYSESSLNATTAKIVASNSNNYSVQLLEGITNDKDLDLWKSNGYPSPQLLKLMRDIVSGIAHLHELGFVHRDLKPHNILIIKDKVFCAKLSDMGISKRLVGDVSSLTQNASGAGSSGWRSPEQIMRTRQSRAVDLFSLGCVLFFCMTRGKHPFGDIFERDSNIVKNEKDLFLVEHVPEALDLIDHLLDPIPELRPKSMEVLHHPLFWTSEKRLSFLRDASDRVELEDREMDSSLLKTLEATAPVALGGKWDDKLEGSFLNNINRYRRYKYDSVRDLLRVIRNKLNHYRELPTEIQEVLGSVPEGFDNYFTVRFPKLLIEVYRVILASCREEELLGKYFKSSLL